MKRQATTYRVSSAAMVVGAAFGAGLILALLWATSAGAATPSWQPAASERLVKLPASYLHKAVERDLAESELGTAIKDTTTKIGLKVQTLKDLQAAIDKAEGDVQVELKHQFLAEKQEYIKLMGERHDMARKQAETKIKLYERLLDKMARQGRAMTPTKVALLEKQKAAQARFENSVSTVDLKLFGSAAIGESRYSKAFSKNMAEIEKLRLAIESHPMNAGAEVDGQEVTKQDYVRHLIADNQTTLAIIDQEESILGYMAKLVALDAMALSEEVADKNIFGDDVVDENGDIDLTSAVDFFITQ